MSKDVNTHLFTFITSHNINLVVIQTSEVESTQVIFNVRSVNVTFYIFEKYATYVKAVDCVAFWAVLLCSLVGGYGRFEGRYRLSPKMEAMHFSETSVSTSIYKSTRHHNTGYHNQHLHRLQNLKSVS
jgi:hypothetical protein